MKTNRKPNILFLCTGNSCRSQMAEGFARNLLSDSIIAYSAGIQTHGLNPRAVKVMQEVDVDISSQQSQHLDELIAINFDMVVTVCDNASQSCPTFPSNAKVVHHSFDDPPKLAKQANSEEEILDAFRRVRDEVRSFVKNEIPVLLS